MPIASRSSGPDIAVSARAAQSLSLLFFELASHSDEGLSLVGKHPHIVANWEVTGEDPDAVFTFRWEEFNTSAATRRKDSDFGLILLDRVAPEALGGTSKRYFTDVQLRLRTHRADGHRRRHDRARPHRTDFSAACGRTGRACIVTAGYHLSRSFRSYLSGRTNDVSMPGPSAGHDDFPCGL